MGPGSTLMPPTAVFKEKLTSALDTGPPDWSSTWKTTVEVSGVVVEPTPLSEMILGVADL